MLTRKEQEYLDNLILNDLLEGEDFLEITNEGIDALKKYTFTKGISERIGLEQYTRNLRKILKYQYDTKAPYNTLLKTVFHIVSSYTKFKSQLYGIDACIISYMIIGEKYGYDFMVSDPSFFDSKNKNREVNKDWYNLSYILSLYATGDNDELEKDYITLMKTIFDNIGYEEGYNFLKIANIRAKGLRFSIVYLLWEKGFELSFEQKKLLYNPWNFAYEYNPIINNVLDLPEVKKKYLEFRDEYFKISPYSEYFSKFIYDSFYYHIIRKKATQKKEIEEFLLDFQKKYRKIGNTINNDNLGKEYDENELKTMKNQFLFMDLVYSRTRVERILEESDITDLRKLYDYLHGKVTKSLWINYGKNCNDSDSIFYFRFVIFELSRLFLHKQIKKEQFDWLHSIYQYTTNNSRIAVLYNLTLGKFSFSFTKISTEYFLQGYNLLLKQMFKNFWLGTPGKNLEKFKEIGKEALNYEYGEDDNTVIDIKEFEGDIYEKEYADEILKNYGIKEAEFEGVYSILGFNVKTGFILKDEFKSFKEYLLYKINEGDNIYFEKKLVKNILVFNTLAEQCKEYKLFRVDDELYIPLKKTEKKGLNRLYIEGFFNTLRLYFSNVPYFTVKNIREKIDTKIIDSFGFADEFFENIVFYNSEISFVKIGNHKIFTYMFEKPTIYKFIEEEMNKYNKIYVDDFAENISKEYGLDIEHDLIIRNLSGSEKVFYAKTLDKLYLNQQDFYNEVYGND